MADETLQVLENELKELKLKIFDLEEQGKFHNEEAKKFFDQAMQVRQSGAPLMQKIAEAKNKGKADEPK